MMLKDIENIHEDDVINPNIKRVQITSYAELNRLTAEGADINWIHGIPYHLLDISEWKNEIN